MCKKMQSFGDLCTSLITDFCAFADLWGVTCFCTDSPRLEIQDEHHEKLWRKDLYDFLFS